jgi:large subunit ribosomal protein L34
MKRTYQPHKLKKKKTHGFLSRMETPGGKQVIKRIKGKQKAKGSPFFLTGYIQRALLWSMGLLKKVLVYSLD